MADISPPSAASPPTAPCSSTSPPKDAPCAEAFSAVLSRLSARIEAGDRAFERIESAGRGAEVDAVQLIELQAVVYRHVEAVELAAKVVEGGARAVRTVMQTQ